MYGPGQEVAAAGEGHAHGRVDVALTVADHRLAHTGRKRGGTPHRRLYPAEGLLLLQLQRAAPLLLLPAIGTVAAPHLHVAEAHRHAAGGIHHHARVGENTVLPTLARAVAEVLVVKRQAALMAERDLGRVLDAEHVREARTPLRAVLCQTVDHLIHSEPTIVNQTVRCDALRAVLAAFVDDAGVFLHHPVGKPHKAFSDSGIFADALKNSLNTYKGTKNPANGQYIIC